jgi:hypothetical protein
MLDLKQYLEKRDFQGKCPPGELDEKTIFSVFRMVIQSEYGDRGKESIEPRLYKERRLFVGFQSSLWASEIWLNRKSLIEKTNSMLGAQAILEIKVSLDA